MRVHLGIVNSWRGDVKCGHLALLSFDVQWHAGHPGSLRFYAMLVGVGLTLSFQTKAYREARQDRILAKVLRQAKDATP